VAFAKGSDDYGDGLTRGRGGRPAPTQAGGGHGSDREST